jgi:hypothetical protein
VFAERSGSQDQKGESMKSGRHYTTERIEGGIAFKCEQCEYRVTTLDFQSKDGNIRTQAATSVNEHAVLVHHQPMLVSADRQRRY